MEQICKAEYDPIREKEIDSFIPIASGIADRQIKEYKEQHPEAPSHPYLIVKGVDGKAFNFDLWTQYFHGAMDYLTGRAGLRAFI